MTLFRKIIEFKSPWTKLFTSIAASNFKI